jgi:hypothetical protein
MIKLVPVYNAPRSLNEFETLITANAHIERDITVGVVRIEEPLPEVDAFKADIVSAAEPCAGLALYLPNENLGAASDFYDVPGIVKVFVEGVEVQLRRKVLFVGVDSQHWLTVPIEVQDRYKPSEEGK